MSAPAKSPARRIYVLDNPRSRSHLFFRMLATHPNMATIHHPYVNAGFLGPDKISYRIYADNPRRKLLSKEIWEPFCRKEFTWEAAEHRMMHDMEAAEKEGKIALMNEHCSYVMQHDLMVNAVTNRHLHGVDLKNPTLLPDELWDTMTPILLIRHPVLCQTSLYRTINVMPQFVDMSPLENHFYWFGTLAWSRLLFDTLKSQGREPIVVDAEDVCTRTDEVIKGLCDRLGLESSDVKDEWTPWGKEWADELAHPIFVEMTRSTWESKNIHKYESKGPINTDEELAKFEKQFGSEKATQLRTAVESQMDNFRYLTQFKI